MSKQAGGCPVIVIIIAHISVDQLPFGTSSRQHGYSSCVQQLNSKPGGYAYIAKITSTLKFLEDHDASHDQLYVLMDAFDTYFRHSPIDLVKRVRDSGKRLIISSEIMFTHQPDAWKPFFDRLSKHESRYLNSGILVGYGDVMRLLLKYSANSSSLVLSNRRGTDQASIAYVVFQHGFHLFRGSLDYEQSIVYTATGKRWSLKQSNEDIAKYDPVIVHFPFTAAPRVNRTFIASYDGQQGFAWPEADFNFCRAQEKACALNHDGQFCHVGGGHRPGMNRLAC